MKRIKIVAAIILGCLLVGVIALALRVTMTGSGSLGGVLPGWSILESCTPSMPGDSRGSLGGASFSAHAKTDSRFVADNTVELSHVSGDWLGRVSEVQVGARADVSAVGALQFLNVDKTMPPIWFTDANDFLGFTYGSGTGQVASTYGIAVDPVDNGVIVASYGTVDGVDRYKIIKFDSDGVFVTEFGSAGTGNGQFGTVALSVSVSPVDQAIWVGDGNNSRIQKFTTADGGLTYAYSTKVGTNGAGNGQFGGTTNAINVAVDSSGNVYATDRGNVRLQKFNSSAVYQAQVSTSGSFSPYDVDVSGSSVWINYPSITGPEATFARYNSSLVLQETLTIAPPPGIGMVGGVGGILSFAFDANGDFWASWVGATYLVKYNTSGGEIERWQSLFPVPTVVNTNITVAVGALGAYVMYRSGGYGANPYGGAYVVGFDYSPVVLSTAIEQYMEECGLTDSGWTLDYQGAVDPEVVIPGWTGNVWANLKELFATYNVELVYDATTQTIIIRDIGSATTTFTNIEPATTQPVNLTGGRVVDVIYQQPRAGGGVVWDAATENVAVSIATGARTTRILATDNHPAELAQPVPTDTLPIQPGQYYVVDSTGTHVPAATWLRAGGNITLAVGDSPGTISATIQGPASNPSGFTGPYSFVTGNDPDDTPALSIVGNGTFTTPARFVKAGSQGQPFNSPFIDTVDRLLQRGHYPSLKDPNVVVNFTVPTADLPPMGQAVGTIFPFEDSRYRILEVQWGNLKSRITAERWVTADDYDTVWAGQTADDYDTVWAGYSASDYQIQPLRTA